MDSRVEGIQQEIVGGQQTVLDQGCMMEADIVPYDNTALCHMARWYQNVVQSVQKCEHVGCAVWTRLTWQSRTPLCVMAAHIVMLLPHWPGTSTMAL